ncbi:MAG: hypoxanthine-guanine phosphoribosyltransferase [Pseudomonadota bacterium]
MSRIEEAQTLVQEADCLFDAAAVRAAYDAIAAQLNADYAGRLPLVLCVMNGGLYATSEITQRLTFAFELDYLHATRYRGATTGGGLIWKRQPDTALEGRDVIVIDDILDEGHTLVAIRKALLEFNPKSLKVAVLAEKLHDRRAPEAYAEYIGLAVPDRYVFGCGMDVRELWRQLPGIYAVKGL